MQDVIAIVIAVGTALWLVRSLAGRLFAPPCRPPDAPDGADGFVPLEWLSQRKR